MPDETSRKAPDSSVWPVIAREARLIGRLILDRRVPWYLKLLPIGAAVYAVSPVDLLPLNPLDDAAVVSLAFYLFVELCPPEVVAEHRQSMKGVVPGRWRDPEAPPSSEKEA